ncbi:UNVERIFIED_CONTAM: G-type lectin S-receptor-like serine/threonine-protein kinase [Sesamum calycinum]|uniref:non-specific serine/threonine protein kinase n=1 Tax=Sesamum calycinum TaxID=2727403 RepID=A0AAW2Q4V6_9LAMI
MKTSIEGFQFLIFVLYLVSVVGISRSADTINTTQVIRDGDTIVSPAASFELGFFRPGNSTNLYVGIWYKNVTLRTPIWVANREFPVRNTSSAALKFIQTGNLVLQDENGTIWSSNVTRAAQNPVAQLLDSGNLVIREANDDRPGNYLWQSFDHPTNTFLQGMDFGWNFVTGIERYVSSWKSNDDPARGDFTFRLDITGYPQVVIKRGDSLLHRLGPWNGMRFSGTPSVRQNPTFTAGLYMNSSVIYYREDALDRSVVSRFSLSPSGAGQRLTWVERSQEWVVYYNLPTDICDDYGLCGAHGSCSTGTSPACSCLDRFVPKDEQAWFTWFNESLTLEECQAECLRNCSCMAYSNLDIRRGGSGCLLWFGDLVDIRLLPGEEQIIYIRMAASELDSKGKKQKTLIAVLTSTAGIILLGLSLILFIWKRKKNHQNLRNEGGGPEESHKEDLELPMFDLSTVTRATNNFSISNKLGKGMLEDGKEIAVKRLSRTSTQGLDEFKNEVIFIAKLQHRNLVKLLGCCIQGEEKMLIYEYMPNRSLDLILFDKRKGKQLDWPKRFHIINGIARGLLYLHQDSRLRIIHRDLKASNILLDNDMNPKISDFGMARSFGGNETEANTQRVVGTYGYMSPEYAADGLFSVKSDVYSFGVLVLEIVSGQKNRGFHHKDHHHNLLGHAWMLHKERRSIELVDVNLVDSFNFSEVVRSIHVALLCVQQSPEDRPSMSSVVLMLGSEGVLPQPKLPGFFTERDVFAAESTTSTKASSSNNVTITLLDARETREKIKHENCTNEHLTEGLLTPSLLSDNPIITSGATDTINTTHIIRDGDTMVSSGGMFELGFFSPGNSRNRYVGIWFKNITVRTVVWVANREIPLPNESGVLKVMEPGILALLNDINATIWSSNISRSVQNPVAQLLDSGNLVVRNATDDNPGELPVAEL